MVEASSGSTAVSEAYFAQMIGVPFYAVMPRTTSAEKIAAIAHYGGNCHLIDDGRALYAEAAALAARLGGHYMDQFTFAERATDWRGNNNIAESIFTQLRRARPGADLDRNGRRDRRHLGDHRPLFALPLLPDAALRRRCRAFGVLRLLPQQDRSHVCERPSLIEGVGRPRCEPSFVPGVVDRMMKVPDAASIAAMNVLSRRLRRPVGGSTGTNFLALCRLASEMRRAGETGSLVTLICDSGERYRQTYYAPEWLAARGLDPAPYEAELSSFLETANPLGFRHRGRANPSYREEPHDHTDRKPRRRSAGLAAWPGAEDARRGAAAERGRA